MPVRGIRTRRWTRVEYERLIEAGMLRRDERVELIDGEMIVREPHGSPHATAIQLIEDALRAAFGRGYAVRVQLPIALDASSEPEPDVAVVRGSARDFREAHPSLPVLLVEVADEGLDFDRRYKGSLYARAGVEDYWVMNLVSRELEVHRDPVASAAALYGWEYRWVHSFGRRDCVAPLAAPFVRIPVGDLLP